MKIRITKVNSDLYYCAMTPKWEFDVHDQMTRLSSVKERSKRWPVDAFYNVVDMAILNSWVIYKVKRCPDFFNVKERFPKLSWRGVPTCQNGVSTCPINMTQFTFQHVSILVCTPSLIFYNYSILCFVLRGKKHSDLVCKETCSTL